MCFEFVANQWKLYVVWIFWTPNIVSWTVAATLPSKTLERAIFWFTKTNANQKWCRENEKNCCFCCCNISYKKKYHPRMGIGYWESMGIVIWFYLNKYVEISITNQSKFLKLGQIRVFFLLLWVLSVMVLCL